MAFTRILPAGISTTGTVFLENVTASGIITATTFDGDFGGTSGLAEVSKTISDNPVDVFVYDTTKDSDGGAWRYRTQHTSWYKETLNTSTRGSRREFPAVAVIVVSTSSVYGDTLTIYDGDDPDLPMWMVFKGRNINAWIAGWRASIATASVYIYLTCGTAVSALNGKICVSHNDDDAGATYSSGHGIQILDFLTEKSQVLGGNNYSTATSLTPFINRNTFSSNYYRTVDDLTSQVVASVRVNDVAMTVLPNAPIDDTTGLQVPTIAIATDGGVSVIRDDGTVVDITATGYTATDNKIDFDHLNNVLYLESGGYPQRQQIPTSDISRSDGGRDRVYGGTSSYVPTILGTSSNIVTNSDGFATGSTSGLSILDYDSSQSQEMVAYAATSYNTGWMHGDIKGSFLSDTDTTNVTGTELVTNGNFALNSDWTAKGDTGLSISGGQATITLTTTNGQIHQNLPTLSAGTYVLSVEKVGGTELNLYATFQDATSGNTRYNLIIESNISNGTYSATVTIPSTENNLRVAIYGYFWGGTHNGYTLIIDNVSLRPADPDRSVNNKGIQAFGTITKTPVATNAELVGYRPPSGTVGDNYLSKPLTSSDFDLTSDWSITFWAKRNEQTANNYSGFEIAEDDITGNNAYAKIPFSIYIDDSGNTGWRGANVTGYQYDTLFNTQDVWKCVTTISKSGNLYIYVDGEYVTSTPATFTNPSNPYSLGIFRFSYSESRHDGRRHIDYALFRMSNSAPSAEQVKKMYEDEKYLFQENAKCTLYGASDAVTALAYDEKTELLHVGTSSGRSDFQGLCRINNTTEAVTTAISAYDGSIAQQ